MILKIGERYTLEVKDFAEASRIYCELRDKSGEGASTWPDGELSTGHYISYNGKVWAQPRNELWEAIEAGRDIKPVYNPFL